MSFSTPFSLFVPWKVSLLSPRVGRFEKFGTSQYKMASYLSPKVEYPSMIIHHVSSMILFPSNHSRHTEETSIASMSLRHEFSCLSHVSWLAILLAPEVRPNILHRSFHHHHPFPSSKNYLGTRGIIDPCFIEANILISPLFIEGTI